MIMTPAVSGFSATVPAPAAPILDCAQPHAIAPPKKAMPAPIGTAHSTIKITRSFPDMKMYSNIY
jgi:hypothetical protein